MATGQETLDLLKTTITEDRTKAVEHYDTMLAQLGSMEESFEREKKAYGEAIRKETLAKLDDMDGEGRIYTEADMQALKDEHEANVAKAESKVEASEAARLKAEGQAKTQEAKAARFQEKFKTLQASYKEAQEKESALEAEVAAHAEDDQKEEEVPAGEEVVNEETGEIEKR